MINSLFNSYVIVFLIYIYVIIILEDMDSMNNVQYDKFLGELYNMLLNKKIISYDEQAKDLKVKKERVQQYLDKLERIQGKIQNNPKYLDIIKELYYDKYIIKREDIPESHFRFIEKKYLEDGQGHIDLVNPKTDYEVQLKEECVDGIIKKQKETLDYWLNYLLGSDSSYLPIWAKVWAFHGMLSIGNINENKDGYKNRGKKTVNPFISLDSEVLAKCVELMEKYLNKSEITESELDKLIVSHSFAKLYGKMFLSKRKIKPLNDDGIWIKYNKETLEEVEEKEKNGIEPEYLKLYNSLQHYNTGWCTAGSKQAAKEQICGSKNIVPGDFYVYYSKDNSGQYRIPRIAIRTELGSIREIRGIADKQNIESNMENIIEEKLKEFPDSHDYQTKVNDMRRLTGIYNKYQNNIDLTKDDLRFLYQIDRRIMTFGFEWHGIPAMDPRVEEILLSRNKRTDFSKIFNCSEDEIGLTKTELKRNLIFYEGDIELSVPKVVRDFVKEFDIPIMVNEFIMPEIVRGDIKLSEIVTAKKIVLPQTVMGNVDLSKLRSVQELVLPRDTVYHTLCLGLKRLTGLSFPKEVGSLSLSVKYANNIIFPQHVYGDVNLLSLIEAENVILPEYIKGFLHLGHLKSLKGIVLPKFVGGRMRGEVFSKSIFYKGQYYKLDEIIELQKQEEMENSLIVNQNKKI